LFYYKRQIYCCYNPYGSHGSQRKSRETTSTYAKKNVRFDLIPEKKKKTEKSDKNTIRKRSKERKKDKIEI